MTNINLHEIELFDQLAQQWWDENGPMKTLHHINPLRVNYIDSRCPVAEKTVLDVGCGAGLLSEALTQRGAHVTGIDASQSAIETAKLHAVKSQLTVNYHLSTAEDFAQNHANHFDVVTCLEMLEHVPDPQAIVQACAQLCKPGGHVFFSTINRTASAFLGAIIGAEYLLTLIPKGTHHYQQLIKPSELMATIRQSNLQAKHLSGIQYNPLTQQCRLSRNVSINYLVHATKPLA